MAEGQLVYYRSLRAGNVAAKIVGVDNSAHPSRFTLRVTATRNSLFRRGMLISTSKNGIQPR